MIPQPPAVTRLTVGRPAPVLTGPVVPYPTTGGITSMLAAIVARSPAAPAARAEQTTLSYGTLWAAAGYIAGDLQRAGLVPGDLVIVAAPRSLGWLVGLVGCWRAGGVYLPLDPTYPAERQAAIRADSPGGYTLTLSMLHVALTAAERAGDGPPIPLPPLTGDSPAYRLYTSGSTGRPKGVQLAHCGLCSLWAAQQFHFELQPGDRVAQLASSHFDASLFECLLAWGSGAALVLVPDGLRAAAGAGLRGWLVDQTITVACLTPSLLSTIPVGPLPALHTLMVAGEACTPALAARWGRGRRFFNLGGVTEGTIWQTIGGPTSDGSLPPLGRPVANWLLRLTDPTAPDQPAEPGVVGELWIGGPGVAQGYTDPALTADRFRQDPTSGHRWYRTGDLVELDGTGRLQWVGRADEQVKLGGQRVELADIAAALSNLPDVREATVALWQPPTGEAQLVGYLVAQPGARPLADSTVQRALADRLPPAWRPTRFFWLPALPRTAHDKIDRAALPPPPATRPPATPTLAGLLEVLTELQTLLSLPPVALAPDTHLFSPEVGGDSLLVLNLVVALEARWGLPVTMDAIYDAPTPAALVAHLTALAGPAPARAGGAAPRVRPTHPVAPL